MNEKNSHLCSKHTENSLDRPESLGTSGRHNVIETEKVLGHSEVSVANTDFAAGSSGESFQPMG